MIALLLLAFQSQTIELPAGDVRGFDINYSSGTGRTKYTTTESMVFSGQGVNETHIRPVGDQAILVDRFNGSVTLENLTIHCGARQGIWFGLGHKGAPVAKKFKLIMRNVRIVADTSTVWGVFSYQADLDLENVTFDLELSNEHGIYAHGFANRGARLHRVSFTGTGAEQFKARCDPSEIDDVRGEWIIVSECEFANWYQPHSWRGGGGIVLQGSSANLYVDRCTFRGGPEVGGIPSSSRTRSIMVDNGGGAFYDVDNGSSGSGYANGRVIIRRSAFHAGPGTANYSSVIRVGNDGGGGRAAKSVTIESCGIWGQNLQLQFSDIDSGQTMVKWCNTPFLRKWARDHDIPTDYEAVIPLRDRVALASEGFVR